MKKTRTNKNKPNAPKGSNKIEKIYYVVIALLVVILGGLVFFIFANQDDTITDGDLDTAPDTEIIDDADEEETTEDDAEETEEPAVTDEAADTADEETDTEEDPDQDADTEETAAEEEAETEDEPAETDDTEGTDAAEEATEDDSEEEADADTEEPAEAETDIDADAPLDESYNINFGDGSSDRNAIAQNASAVSGLNQSDMITWWVGNDGPGRAFTVVSDSGRNNVYRVYMQYGDGQWHVTSAEELDGVPAEYR